MVSRVGAWDGLLSTCMERGKPCKGMMIVHASGGLNDYELEESKKERLGFGEHVVVQ